MREQAPAGLRAWLFAARAWAVLVVFGLSGYLLVLACPGRARRWQLLRVVLHAMSRAGSIPVQVEGRLPEGRFVLAVNHSSFVDGAVLIAAIAEPLEIAVGAVFADKLVTGPVLRALGCVFVGAEDDPARAQVERLTAVAARGRLAVFPEGHLARGEDLDRFHLGAFVAAARAGVDVVPVGIAGSDSVLPPGSQRPCRGAITVRIGQPIATAGGSFKEARRLALASEEAVRALRA